MRTKIFTFAILAFALILSACGPTTIHQDAQPVVRNLNVNGLGEVYLTPDIASIYVGVHNKAKNAADALATNQVQTSAVIHALRQARLSPTAIRSTNFS